MIAPTLTFHSDIEPYSQLNSLTFAQVKDTILGISMPVLTGEDSDSQVFRIYNNFSMQADVSPAYNVYLTTFDGVGIHTASTAPVSQQWVRVYETGFGQSSSSPAVLSSFLLGDDTAIGGSGNVYYIQMGSDGTNDAIIRPDVGSSGAGFVQIASYLQIPFGVEAQQFSWALTVAYNWST